MSERNCQVCFDGDVTSVMVPCGHFVACNSCLKSMLACPLCGVKIQTTQRVFFSVLPTCMGSNAQTLQQCSDSSQVNSHEPGAKTNPKIAALERELLEIYQKIAEQDSQLSSSIKQLSTEAPVEYPKNGAGALHGSPDAKMSLPLAPVGPDKRCRKIVHPGCSYCYVHGLYPSASDHCTAFALASLEGHVSDAQEVKTCQGLTLNGDPCQKIVNKGEMFCYFHGDRDHNRCQGLTLKGEPCRKIIRMNDIYCHHHEYN